MCGPSWISRNLRLSTVYSRDTVTKMKDQANFKNVELWACMIDNSLNEKMGFSFLEPSERQKGPGWVGCMSKTTNLKKIN